MNFSKRLFIKWLGSSGVALVASPFVNFFSYLAEARLPTELPVTQPARTPFLTPRSEGYSNATKTYYPSPCQRPSHVYQPKNEAELSALIRSLTASGTRFAVRGGGHSFDNRSSNAMTVIDTSKLKGPGSGVRVAEDGIVTVQAGAKLGGKTIDSKKTKIEGLYDELSKKNRILAAGTCPGVGVIGNILGGGLSAIPALGYGAKALSEVTFVSFKDGETYTVNEKEILKNGRAQPIDGLSPSELLSVFKGGGQGSLGVVTQIKLKSRKMNEFKAVKIKPKQDVQRNVEWLSKNPKFRKNMYFEAHFPTGGDVQQKMWAMAPTAEWEDLEKQLNIPGQTSEIKNAEELIKSFLDKENNNPNHKYTHGANRMVRIQANKTNLHYEYLRMTGRTGIDTSIYLAPSSEGTILPGSDGSFLVEMEGQGVLEEKIDKVTTDAPLRFANYVTTGIPSKPEEYFDPKNAALLKKAMDHFNPPREDGFRRSTSSLVYDSKSKPAVSKCVPHTAITKTAAEEKPPAYPSTD